MFTLHRWPNKKIHSSSRTGRPKLKKTTAHSQPKTYTALEKLYIQGHMTERDYQTALWYLKARHLYLSAIKAPRVKTATIDFTIICGNDWSENNLISIEKKWQQAQEILTKHGQHTRQIVDQIAVFNQPCTDVRAFTTFLRDLNSE